eukprot:TRINITY_DN266_c0_g2_i2.p1 TRINITY_DN266_c0_g2~~TRINITY_DN266_c0_g2_i2.p1  ORF type:complete len:148 (+),score=29.61 TRINITY_DN266_c0_g2_i2:89-532(+)
MYLLPRHACTLSPSTPMSPSSTPLGHFNLVLAANLIDRLHTPSLFLNQLPLLLQTPGSILVLTSPYTWLEDFTPRSEWIGGFTRKTVKNVDGKEVEVEEEVSTIQGLEEKLSNVFELLETKDLPFVIYETRRKFQFTVAQCSIWRRK